MRNLTDRILTFAQAGIGLKESISLAQEELAQYNREARVAAYRAAGPRRSLSRFQSEKTQEASRLKAIRAHDFRACSAKNGCCTHFDS